MNLNDGDIKDINIMTSNLLIKDLIKIVGFDGDGNPVHSTLHQQIVKQGKTWGNHVREPWMVMVIVGVYIVIAIGFGLPIFGTIATLIANYGAYPKDDYSVLKFSPLDPNRFTNQAAGWTIIGVLIQLLDAWFAIKLPIMVTPILRWIQGRPLRARLGKRTIIIIDSPMVHQLAELFLSKLYSQSYGFVSIDVHGASGVDHFVHRFTHRTVRGCMLAVGRPDGRLSTLCKFYVNHDVSLNHMISYFILFNSSQIRVCRDPCL
jgi:hypothetical protein